MACWIKSPTVNKKCHFWFDKKAKMAKNRVLIFGKIMIQVRVFVGEKSIGTGFKTRRCLQNGFFDEYWKFKNCLICEILLSGKVLGVESIVKLNYSRFYITAQQFVPWGTHYRTTSCNNRAHLHLNSKYTSSIRTHLLHNIWTQQEAE